VDAVDRPPASQHRAPDQRSLLERQQRLALAPGAIPVAGARAIAVAAYGALGTGRRPAASSPIAGLCRRGLAQVANHVLRVAIQRGCVVSP
jgi:hypothetical protein